MTVNGAASTKRFAVFRADASPTIGGGHIMRCLSLADTLTARGWRCAFAVGAGSVEVVPQLASSVHDVTVLSAGSEAAPDLAQNWPEGCDLLVIDHYQLASGDEVNYRSWAHRIAILDDLADRPHDCDFLLDPAPDHVGAYTQLTPADCRVLGGPSWALLQEPFSAYRRHGKVAVRQQLHRLLISFGTVDRFGLCALTLEAVSQAGLSVETDIVIGGASPQLDNLRAAVSRCPNAELHVDSLRGFELMAAADLAVGAGGTTAWERCTLGLPAIVIVTSKNQSGVAAALEDCGAAVTARREALSVEDIAKLLRSLAGDSARLAEMSSAAFGLCDGHGVQRFATLVEDVRVSDGTSVNLRPAAGVDAEIILEWQSHPETRQYFREPRIPTPCEHENWLRGKLATPGCVINIIEHNGEPAGLLRLDAHGASDTLEVSILVAPQRRGLGIGGVALSLLRVLLPDAHFVANIHPANKISKELFAGAGYSFDDGLWHLWAQSNNAGAKENCL